MFPNIFDTECVTVEIEERVLAVEHTEVVADEVTVRESLSSSVEQYNSAINIFNDFI